jgi:hypothetical protein
MGPNAAGSYALAVWAGGHGTIMSGTGKRDGRAALSRISERSQRIHPRPLSSQGQRELPVMTTINGLLDKAKRCIGASDASLKEAAEYIAAAKAQGATQDRIAKAVGKSA